MTLLDAVLFLPLHRLPGAAADSKSNPNLFAHGRAGDFAVDLRHLAGLAGSFNGSAPEGFASSTTQPGSARLPSAITIGIDGLSLWLVILTTLLTPISILASWKHIDHRVKEFFAFLILLRVRLDRRLRFTRPVPVLTCSGKLAWCRCTF